MTKQFEDYFSEPQTDMVSICIEYSEGKADDIYIYGSYEPNMYAFDVYFKVQNMIVRKHKLSDVYPDIDISTERQDSMLDIGVQNLELMNEICKEYNHEMPTEIKLHYNVKKNRLKADYKYDLVYSNYESLGPHDIFDAWFEVIKKETEK